MAINNFSFKSIGSFLQDNVYYIPDYQREYSWEELQIDDFWLDLQNLISGEEEDHFFGQIVVHSDTEENRRFIIDGQQRTTTSVIFLSILNRLFDSFYKNYNNYASRENSEDIRIKYIGRWSEHKESLRLKLSNKDNYYFMNSIQKDTDIELEEPKTKSQKRIYNAYYYLYNKLTDELRKMTNTEQKFAILNEYYEHFVNHFKVMYVETNELEEAFIIFESLNARGKGLETSDLLKNHIFKNSKSQINYVKDTWEKMQSIVDNSDITKFIRHYWNSKENFTRTVTLYKRIKYKINTERNCITLVDELKKLASLYNALSSKDEDSFFTNNDLNKSLKNLKTFNARSFYPIVLAMYNRGFSEESILEVVKQIEILIFRNIIISGKVSNKYEVSFAEIAFNITNNHENEINSIVKNIRKLQISDAEFISAFKMAKITKKSIIRYIFRELNSLFNNEIAIIEDNNKIHIEHIMPEKIGKWKIESDVHDEYLWRLGNLTLLGEEYNREILNKPFKDKLEVYKKSSIKITIDLTKYKVWEKEQIEDRQNELADLATKVWVVKEK
ncbi:DUF262 domain-containing protein [Oceanobacillus oncorhynchi]|uniref:DUF262 domain-containing protein n=1 Tax=Oceanobacillus oncorhynchi TaxID=545501 RepID=UPI0034D69F82